MYKASLGYHEWEERAIAKIRENDFVAFSLHDCYAGYWLPYYRDFLGKIRTFGRLRTLNEIASEIILGSSY